MKSFLILLIIGIALPSFSQNKIDSLKYFLSQQYFNIPYSSNRYEIRNYLLGNNIEITKDENNSSGNYILGTISTTLDKNISLVSYEYDKPTIKFFFSNIIKDQCDSRYLFFPYQIEHFKECDITFKYLKDKFDFYSDSLSVQFTKDSKGNVTGEEIILFLKLSNLNQDRIKKTYGENYNIPYMKIAELKREFFKGVPNIIPDSYQIRVIINDSSIKYIK